jgi:hypothetical protein
MSFMENFKNDRVRFMHAAQMNCVELRLAEALAQNRHSIVVDTLKEIPLSDSVIAVLKDHKFIYRRDTKNAKQYVFFPDVPQVELLYDLLVRQDEAATR